MAIFEKKQKERVLTEEQAREAAQNYLKFQKERKATEERAKQEKKEAKKTEREEKKNAPKVPFKEKITEKKEEHNLNKVGVNKDDDFSQILEEGRIGKFLTVRHIPMPEELKECCDEYFAQLVKGDFKDTKFFSVEDKELHNLEALFFKDNFASPQKEKALLEQLGWMNVHARQIMGQPFTNEKLGAKAIRESWASATDTHKRNYTSVAAWMAVHSFLTDQLLTEDYLYGIIPQTDNKKVIECWNESLNLMADVPTTVKEYFTIGENGRCQFQIDHEIRVNTKKDDSPKEDIPFEEDDSEKKINLETAKAELDKSFADAVAADNLRDERKVAAEKVNLGSAVSKSEDQKEFTFGELKKEAKAEAEPTTINPAKVAAKMNPTRVNEQGMAEAVTFDNYFFNNAQWEAVNPKLSVFTKYVHDCGYSVEYSQDSIYKGLIDAAIINKETDKAIRFLRIDPYLMYGDNLRVVSVTPNNNDIRKESFVAISQEVAVKKLINGEFTEEDRKKVYDALPKCLADFSEKYSFLDKVDMRYLGQKGGMSLKEYKKLVENINTILTNKDTPLCRWRISDIESPDSFVLTCDNSVLCVYDSDILREMSTVENSMKQTWIEFSPSVNNKRGFSIHNSVEK